MRCRTGRPQRQPVLFSPIRSPPVPAIHFHRPHDLGLARARQAARAWADKAAQKFGMECTYEAGDAQDTLHFRRAGMDGTLQVRADGFELAAELGFLFGAFQERIEAELGAQFDALLGTQGEAAPGQA
nr:polyhydroxyalkanoic acid system family protein [Acidovorax sp. SRB_24]